MLQLRLVHVIGLIAILIGIIVNLMRTGVWSSVTFAALGTLVLYLASVQVSCLMTGGCLVSSWFAATTAIIVFASLAYFYAQAVTHNLPLPAIEEQPIATANPTFGETRNIIKDRANIDIYYLQQHLPFSK